MATGYDTFRSKWGLPTGGGGLLATGKTPEQIAEEEEQARLLEEQMAAEAAAAAAEQERQARLSAGDELAPLPDEVAKAPANDTFEVRGEEPEGKQPTEQPAFEVRTDEPATEPLPEELSLGGTEFEVRGKKGSVVATPAAAAEAEVAPPAVGPKPKATTDPLAPTPLPPQPEMSLEVVMGAIGNAEQKIDTSKMTTVDSVILKMARIRRAEIEAEQAAPQTTRDYDKQQAMYSQQMENMMNSDAMWGASAKEFMELERRVKKEIYPDLNTGRGFATLANWQEVVNYRKNPLHLGPSKFVIADAKETTEEPVGTEGDPTAYQSIKSGLATIPQLTERTKEAIYETVGADKLATEAGKDARYYSMLRDTLPKGMSVYQIKNLDDTLTWFGNVLPEQAVLMGPGVASSMYGRAIGGSVGASLGAFGPSFVLGAGEVQEAIKNLDPKARANLLTLGAGGVIGLLDTITETKVGSNLAKAFGKPTAEIIARRMLLMPANTPAGQAMLAMAKEGIKGGGTEFGTEFTQSLIASFTAKAKTGKPITPQDFQNALEEGLTGAGVGTVLTGTTAGVADVQQQRNVLTAPLREAESIQYDVAGANIGQRAFSPSLARGEIEGVPADIQTAKTYARPKVLSEADREEQARPFVVRPTETPVSAEGKVETHVPPSGTITSTYGHRTPFRTANGRMSTSEHKGLDIAKKLNAPVEASASGVVVRAEPRGGYGNQVTIRHSDGTTSTYSHLNKIGVEVGDQIEQGQSVGKAGKTGNATGVHVHYELHDRNGNVLDPRTKRKVMATVDPDTGEVTDDSDYAVNQDAKDFGDEDWTARQQEEDEAFTAATGQQWDEEDFAQPEEEEAEPTIARGVEEEAEPERPTIRRGAVTEALDEGGVAEPAETADSLLASLDEAKAANPARQALAEAQAAPPEAPPEAAAAAEPLAAAAPQGDLTQPLPGEEPMFAQDEETGEQTQEVVGYVNPDTGTVRAIGEAPGGAAPAMGGPLEPAVEAAPPLPEAQPPLPPAAAPVAEVPPAGPMFPITETAVEWTLPPEHDGLSVPERAAILKSMPKSPKGAHFDAKSGRSIGQSVALGMSEAPTPAALKAQSPKFKTAYKLGFVEGKTGIANAMVSTKIVSATSRAEVSPTTPVAKEGSAPAPKKSPAPKKGKKMVALDAKQKAAKHAEAAFNALPKERQVEITKQAYAEADEKFGERPTGEQFQARDKYVRARIDELAVTEMRGALAKPEAKAQPAPTPTMPTKAADVEVEAEKKAEPFNPPDQLAGLDIDQRETVADTLPKAKGGVEETRQARRDGQLQRLGLERPVGTKGKSQSYTTAFNVGVADAEAGIAKAKPVATPAKVAPAKLGGKPTAEVKAKIKEIEKQFGRIEAKAEDIVTYEDHSPGRTKIKALLKGLVKQGIVEQGDLDNVSYLFEDKDMGASDIWDETKQFVEDWRDAQLADLEKAGIKRRPAEEKPSEPQPTSFTERARFKPTPQVEGRVGRHDATPAVGSEGRAGSAAPTGEPVGQTPPVDADGNVHLDHFTLEQNLTETDPDQWGRSSKFLPEEERVRIGKAPGRTYFGIGTGRPGGYRSEFVHPDTGELMHPRFRSPIYRVEAKIPLDRLYDMNGDPDGLKAIGRALPKDERGRYIYKGKPVDGVSLYELLIRDAGYAGYWIKELGMVAAVFEPVQVTPHKAEAKPATLATKPKARITVPFGKKKVPTTIEEYILPPDYQPKDVEAYGSFLTQHLDDVHAALDEFGLQGKHKVTVELIGQHLAKAEGMDYSGVYSFDANTGDLIVRIVAWDHLNAGQTARHEIIHWMRDTGIITKKQWASLARWAENNPEMMAWAEANYPLGPDMTRDGQIEEAVAEGYANWMRGEPLFGQKEKNPDAGVTERFFEFLREMAILIKQAFGKAGVTQAQLNEASRLMASLRTGQHLREWDAAQGKGEPKAPKRSRFERAVAKAVLLNDVTVEQAHLLRSLGEDFFKTRPAWHGTPARMIERFSNAFINTGEKAQAKGWGLYFADKKAVADWYRAKLSMDRSSPATVSVTVGGQPIIDYVGGRFGDVTHGSEWEKATFEVASLIHDYLTNGGHKYNGWTETLHVAYDKEMGGALADAANGAERQMIEADQRKVAQIFHALRMKDVAFDRGPSEGALYKVEIPDNHLLLDLDQKLGDQPTVVTAALTTLRGHLSDKGLLAGYEAKYGDFWSWSAHDLQMRILPRDLLVDEGFPSAPEDSELGVAIEEDDGPKATSLYLKALGIPGNQYLDRDSRDPSQTEKTRNYVIYDDSQIEITGKEMKPERRPMATLAEGKRRVIRSPVVSTLGDPTIADPSRMRRIHEGTMSLLNKLGEWDRSADTDASDSLVDAFKRKVIQRYHQIEKTQGRAAEQLGVGRLDPTMNPMERITADERGYKMEHLMDNQVKPLARELAQRGIELADLGLYLYARHAPARNRAIAKINPEFRTKPGSGMSDAEAAQVMQDFYDEGRINDLQAAAVYIDRMIEMAQQERINGKLLTQAAADKGFKPQDHYVPLRGHDLVEPEFEMQNPIGDSKGKGFSVSGSEGHRMMGRESMADLESIVGYTISQAQHAIDRAYRNTVVETMYNMFRAVPDPNFVKIDRVKRVATWNKKKGEVEYQMQTRMTDAKEEERTIYFKDGDTVHKMTFNEHNPSAMRFVRAAKNLGTEEMHTIFKVGATFTKLWTQANTSWNIDFILNNAVKDIQTGVINASSLDVKGLRRAIVKNLASLGPLRGATLGSFNAAGAGEGSGNPWFETYAEFEAAGGKLNYNQTEQLDDILKRAKREMAMARRSAANPIKAGVLTLEFISNLNSSLENMTRLAAYKALRDAGIEAKQAAEAVRELTTNFQQHGEWGPKVNAFYGFANASTIGSARLIKTMATSPLLMVGLMTAGAVMDLMNHLLEPDDWDKYTEEEKDSAFKLMLPEWVPFDVNISAGYGINTFISVGRKMSELWRGKKNEDGTKLSLLEAASDVMYSAINAFAPISGRSWMNILAPSILDPVANIINNRNNWGRKLYPDEYPGQVGPQSQQAFESTSEGWKSVATAMNAWTGGNDVVKGMIDVHPASLEHMFSETVGGLGRTVGRLYSLPGKVVSGEWGPNDLPVVRRFATLPHGADTGPQAKVATFNQRFYTARDTIAEAKKVVERYGLDSPEYKEFYADNKPAIKMQEVVKKAGTALDKINTAKKALTKGMVNAGGLTPKQQKAILKATGILYPTKKQLTQAQVDKAMAKIDEQRLHLAENFDALWQRKVMGAEAKATAPTTP